MDASIRDPILRTQVSDMGCYIRSRFRLPCGAWREVGIAEEAQRKGKFKRDL